MNGFLVDTQSIIWYFDGNKSLPAKIAKAISNPSNPIFVSRVSFWEIAIKVSLGKLTLSVELNTLMEQCQNSGFTILGLENEHILELQTLLLHHRDPFDRLLTAQCKAENLKIISSDSAFEIYGIEQIWK